MTQDTHDTPEQPRPLTDAEVDALRNEMKEAATWARAELRRRDHTPNALTAETLQKSDAGVDVHQAGSIDELFKPSEFDDSKADFQQGIDAKQHNQCQD